MVNYRYDLNRISENHEAFANQHAVVAMKPIRSLAADAGLGDSA